MPKASDSPNAQSSGAALSDGVAPLLDETAQLGMQVEAIRETGDTANHALDHLPIDGGARAEARRYFAGHGAQFL